MGSFTINGSQYQLNNKPFQIISGALHYFRIPRDYWDDRLYKARYMGLNTIETYAPWNLHEPQPGKFNFSDNLDLVEFIQTAAKYDLKVIFRPGPYICSEWDFGGLPAWLLKDPKMRIRCAYPPYLEAVSRYLKTIIPLILPLQITQAGPVIMFQIENEYGSYGNDKTYLTYLVNEVRQAGVDVLLFTSDGEGGNCLPAGTLDDIHATVNFGFRPLKAFDRLRKFQPNQPVMCMEFWDGWFDYWGKRHHRRPAFEAAKTLDTMLQSGASVNLYMFHGGTNFGFMGGANDENGEYKADTTSYDYDAPLSESGELTKKYDAFRKVISKYCPLPEMETPKPIPTFSRTDLAVQSHLSLWESLPFLGQKYQLPAPEPMEYLDQDYGFILYRNQLQGPVKQNLHIEDLHDRAILFQDKKYIGTLERNKPNKKIEISLSAKQGQLDILVENMGRVNYGPKMLDRKGILGGVWLYNNFLFDWEIFTLPLKDLSPIKDQFKSISSETNGPGFFRCQFELSETADTFLALPGWTKGVAWINGFNLGRYWKIGPQKTLYVPAPWLKTGKNEIILFELEGTTTRSIQFREKTTLS